jgi:hypothetical protein
MCRRVSFHLIACIGMAAVGGLVGCGDDSGSAPSRIALPCDDLSTQYVGDELCLQEPDPADGFQLHFGPEAYDEASVEPFLIYPGEENTECIYVTSPNDVDVFANEFRGRMRPGSHHMITYTMNAEPDEEILEPSRCGFGLDSQFLLGSQEPTIDISANEQAPEHQGYALPIKGRQPLRIELHYINTTSEPILREAWVNVGTTDPNTVTTEMGPLFWIAQVGMTIPARAEGYLVQGSCSPTQDMPVPMEIMQITGHFHASTNRMSAWLRPQERPSRCTDAFADGCTLLYEGYDYNDPGWTVFDSVTQNPQADRGQLVPGGDYSGNLHLEPGDRIDFECEVDNPWDFDMGFGNSVYEAEMCNVFGTYAPNLGGPWNCIIL